MERQRAGWVEPRAGQAQLPARLRCSYFASKPFTMALALATSS
jgi:hypothetical protein